MKIRIILFFLLLTSLLQAQNKFRAGLLVGLNGCQIHGDNAYGYDKAGLLFGGFVASDPEERSWWQLEMEYSQKGSRKLANPNKGDYNAFEYRLNYIDVPFTIHFNLKKQPKVNISLGANVGVLVNVRQFDAIGERDPQDFRRLEFSGILGVGYKINENWGFDFRANNSIFPVLPFDTPFYYPRWYQQLFNKGMYNNILSLSLQYRFSPKGDE